MEKSRNTRLIAIDDDEIVLRAYQGFLSPETQLSSALENMITGKPRIDQQQEFSIDVAIQGELGFDLIRQAKQEKRPYAVAFVDMIMPPGWDGLKTAQAIREIDNEIFIVFVTAKTEKNLAELQHHLGKEVMLISKPFCRDELLQMAQMLSAFWDCKNQLQCCQSDND